MQNNQQEDTRTENLEVQKAKGQVCLKNQNPNQNHNTKKEALGPNTKR